MLALPLLPHTSDSAAAPAFEMRRGSDPLVLNLVPHARCVTVNSLEVVVHVAAQPPVSAYPRLVAVPSLRPPAACKPGSAVPVPALPDRDVGKVLGPPPLDAAELDALSVATRTEIAWSFHRMSIAEAEMQYLAAALEQLPADLVVWNCGEIVGAVWLRESCGQIESRIYTRTGLRCSGGKMLSMSLSLSGIRCPLDGLTLNSPRRLILQYNSARRVGQMHNARIDEM